jgi:serine/threonine protein kinase
MTTLRARTLSRRSAAGRPDWKSPLLVSVSVSSPTSLFPRVRLAESLQYAHEGGAWHRDVKLLNVFLTADDQPTLLNFNRSQSQAADRSALRRPWAAQLLTWSRTSPGLGPCGPVQARQVHQRANIYSQGFVSLRSRQARGPRRPERRSPCRALLAAQLPVRPTQPAELRE